MAGLNEMINPGQAILELCITYLELFIIMFGWFVLREQDKNNLILVQFREKYNHFKYVNIQALELEQLAELYINVKSKLSPEQEMNELRSVAISLPRKVIERRLMALRDDEVQSLYKQYIEEQKQNGKLDATKTSEFCKSCKGCGAFEHCKAIKTDLDAQVYSMCKAKFI